MKVSGQVSLFAGGVQQEKQTMHKALFTGNGNAKLLSDKLSQRKEQAQWKARKLVLDAWKGDKSIDEELHQRQSTVENCRRESAQIAEKRKEISQKQDSLQASYGVAEDSKEQKNLELLYKKYNLRSGAVLTPQERAYVENCEREGLTEYQTRQLELEAEKKSYEQKQIEYENTMLEELAIIRGIKQERLKSSPMLKAQEQADAIEEAASEEIMDMVMDDAKEKLDEQQEERQEQAEELAESKEQQEKWIEEQKEKQKKQEELLEKIPLEEMVSLENTKANVKQEVQKILDDMKLVAEDIKGSMLDENL